MDGKLLSIVESSNYIPKTALIALSQLQSFQCIFIKWNRPLICEFLRSLPWGTGPSATLQGKAEGLCILLALILPCNTYITKTTKKPCK